MALYLYTFIDLNGTQRTQFGLSPRPLDALESTREYLADQQVRIVGGIFIEE